MEATRDGSEISNGFLNKCLMPGSLSLSYFRFRNKEKLKYKHFGQDIILLDP